MEKEQKIIIDLMINSTYAPVIKKAIANLVLLDIGKLISKHKIENKFTHAKIVSEELINSISKLIFMLDNIHSAQRGDIIDEILKQYGLSLNKSETDYYHQVMEGVFFDAVDDIKKLIGSGNYNAIYQIVREQP
jgi:hypothetical protein